MVSAEWRGRLLGAGALAFALSATAADAPSVSVRDARILAPLPGQEVAVGYMTIASPTVARVIRAESGVARSVQFHAMSMDGGIMRMRRLPALELPAGGAVRLAPGGVHLMLIGLSRPLHHGDLVDIRFTLSAADGGPHFVNLRVPVVDRGRGAEDGHD